MNGGDGTDGTANRREGKENGEAEKCEALCIPVQPPGKK